MSRMQMLLSYAVVGASFLSSTLLLAQGASLQVQRGMTRAAIEQEAIEAEREAASATSPAFAERKRAEAWLLRERLRSGDFRVGDRIIVTSLSHPELNDTLSVHEGRVVHVPTMPPIDLSGVLWSDLESHLTTELARYVRSPDVRVRALVRIAVSGQVTRPGYHLVPPDTPLSELLMIAGGPTGEADLTRSSLRRGQETLWKAGDVTTALSDGVSLDLLQLRGGDELVVGERRRTNWSTVLQTVGMLTGAVSLLIALLT